MSISNLAAEVDRLTHSIQDHISTQRYQAALFANSNTWNQICSSLYVIGDSLHAVMSYESQKFPKDDGLKYIYTYGLLQALFLMQDALRHLSEAFNVPYELTETLREIRNTRNASIGHPTKQDRKGQRHYNYISRISMTKSGFDLMQSCGEGEHSFTHVDLSTACSDQLHGIIDGYRKIAKKLEEIDQMHKDKFIANPLGDIFHSAMGYSFEKISQGIHSHSYGDREFGYAQIGAVKKTYEEFKTALVERSELSEDIKFDLNTYFHAISRLDVYLSGKDVAMQEADAGIYLSYLRHKHKHFMQIAKEIDEEYESQT